MINHGNEKGSVGVSANVYTEIAGTAAINCMSVKGMVARSLSDGLHHLLRRESMAKGVKIHYHSDNSLSIDLHVMVGDGVNLHAVGKAIIEEVKYMVTKTTGTKVRKVNVFIDAIKL